MDRSIADAPAALPGSCIQMGPQLCQAIHTHSLGVVEPHRLAGPAQKLWDSRRTFPMLSSARRGFPAGVLETHGTATQPKEAQIGKFLNSKLESNAKSPEN